MRVHTILPPSGTRMSVSDGTLTIVAKNQSAMDKVLEKVFVIQLANTYILIGCIFFFCVTWILHYY